MFLHNLSAPVSDVTVDVSVILVAEGSSKGLVEIVDRYCATLDRRGESYEFLLLYDEAQEGTRAAVRALAGRNARVIGIPLRPWRGHDDALMTGVGRAAGEVVLTLTKWPEVDPDAIGKLIDAVGEVDLATGLRIAERPPSSAQTLRGSLANGLLWLLFRQRFQDLFCRTRAGRREVFRKIADLGVRQHFIPLVAISEGYRVREVPVPVAPDASTPKLHRLNPLSQLSALADILTLHIGLKFLRRPLRFFGAIGLPLMLFGGAVTAYLAVSRLALGTSLADRPALVFSVIMLVLGVQIIALGLIGEIIIFASTRRLRSYEIEEIIRGRPSDLGGPPAG